MSVYLQHRPHFTAVAIRALVGSYDNLIWLFCRDGKAVVVDPGEAAPVLDWCRAHHVRISDIWVTHHHGDHVNGIAEIVEATRKDARLRAQDEQGAGISVYGPRLLREVPTLAGVPYCEVQSGDALRLFDAQVEAIATPGHTPEHVIFYSEAIGMLCAGDVLFGAGSGRIMEGTANEMWQSINKLMTLPPKTDMYVGHYYTHANVRFALQVEPDNAELTARWRALKAEPQTAVFTTVGMEVATNPFCRAHLPSIQAACEAHFEKPFSPGLETYAAVREWRNAA